MLVDYKHLYWQTVTKILYLNTKHQDVHENKQIAMRDFITVIWNNYYLIQHALQLTMYHYA